MRIHLGGAIGKTIEASAYSREKLGEGAIIAPREVSAGSKFNVEWTGPLNARNYVLILPKGSEN